MTLAEFLIFLDKEAEKDGSQAALARRLNVSAPYLSDVLNGRREPGDAILEPLGFRRVIVYERIQKGKGK